MSLESGLDLIPLVVSLVMRLLSRVQKVVNSNSSSLKVSNFVFSRIGFSIQKGVAAQLVARLPAIAL
ncbi:hypothetical protein Hanom_Chr07g00672061 [Helianthus anomalus]